MQLAANLYKRAGKGNMYQPLFDRFFYLSKLKLCWTSIAASPHLFFVPLLGSSGSLAGLL